jgi:hypothetical protein
MVQAFSANASDDPFRIAVLPRTSGRYRNLSDTQSIDSRFEIMTVDSITLSRQIAGMGIVGKRFYHLPCRPSSGWVFRDIEMQNTTSVMRQDYKDIQHAELYGWNRNEGDRDHLANVVRKTSSRFDFPVFLGISRETVRSEILSPSGSLGVVRFYCVLRKSVYCGVPGSMVW